MPSQRSPHVVVGLSGGVDSTVSALLLQQQGYKVSGLFMKNWEGDDTDNYCASEEDLQEVRRVCAHLEIPLRTVNFSQEYWDRVFTHFLAEYQAGRTPNPDVLCNQEIKFKAFLDHALTLGADYIATGHYVRIDREGERLRLLKGLDGNKDQSYFLYTLGQSQLARSLFPVGALEKTAVRALAQAAGLPNYARKDSTGICFIGERHFKEFLGRYLPAQPGDLRTLAGEQKGRHDGLMYYTLGQRQGLGIGGPGEPWYVVGKDLQRNILYVEQGQDHPALYSSGLQADCLHWTSGQAPATPFACRAKTRYRQADQDCLIESIHQGVATLRFQHPQRAITPGQALVFYQGECCLGGGTITQALANNNALDAAKNVPQQVKYY